jgi:tRNA threonylcarbamoyladenosine biosynthesis protein TsaE
MPVYPQILDDDRRTGVMDLLSRSEQETEHLGRLLACFLLPGDVVSLDGDLGAGKTVLTRGIAEGLGCRGTVASPTFVLLAEHPAGRQGAALYHFDAYRLNGADEFTEAGLDEYFEAGGVCVLEWGSRITGILPDRTLAAVLRRTGPDMPDERLVRLSWPERKERLETFGDELARAIADQVKMGQEGNPC